MLVLLVGVVAIAIVLQTRLPERVVLDAVSRETGLWVRASRVDVGWDGRTVLRDVEMGAPMVDRPLVKVSAVTVEHTSIPGLIVRRRVRVVAIHADKATLEAREDASGRWDVARAALLVAQTRASRDARGGSGGDTLPRVIVTDSAVRLHRHGAEAREYSLDFDGAPGDAMDWGFEGVLGPVMLRGHVAPAGWMHVVELESADASSLIEPWVDALGPIAIDVRWEGDLLSEGLDASLDVRHVTVGDTAMDGRLDLRLNSEGLVIAPGELRAHAGAGVGMVVVRGGVIRVTDTAAVWEHVIAEGLGTTVQASGTWDVAKRSGEVRADWSGADDLLGVRHRGELSAQVGSAYGGRHTISLELGSRGRAGLDRWEGSLSVSAHGREWSSMRGQLEVPSLVITGPGEPIDLSGLEIGWSGRDSLLTLTQLVLPGAPATIASGEFDLDDMRWLLSVESESWQVPGARVEPIALRLEAGGWGENFDVSALHLESSLGSFDAWGVYRGFRPEPFRASVRTSMLFAGWPASSGRHDDHAHDELDDDGHEPMGPAPGRVAASFDVIGTISPRSLEVTGHVSAQGVPVGHGVLDTIDLGVRGSADEVTMSFEADPFEMVGGMWTLSARQEHASPDAEIGLVCEGASLSRLAELIAPPLEVEGAIDLEVRAMVPEFELSRTQVDGRWSVTEGSGRGEALPNGGGRIGVSEGRVRLSEIELVQGDARASGSVEFDAMTPTQLEVALRTVAWPVGLRGTRTTMLVDATASGTVDLAQRGAEGDVRGSALVWVGEQEVGTVEVVARVAGRTIAVESLDAGILGGRAIGRGVVSVDEWTTSWGHLAIESMDLGLLGRHEPALGDLRGVLSGTLWATPTEDERALEPLEFGGLLSVEGGMHNGLAFESAELGGYAGEGRFVLDRFRARVAGGEASVWSRLSWHEDEPFLHASIDARDLRIEQIVRAASDEVQPTPGLLGFELTFGGYALHPHRAFGHARAHVRQSNLAPLPVISQLYSILSLEPEGSSDGDGVAYARLEGDTLHVEGLRYANRGSELIGAGRVENIWLGMESPVSGSVAAAANPIGEGIEPLSRGLGRAFLAATDNLASVRLGGTLRRLQTDVVTFEDVSSGLGRLLGRP